MSYDDLQSTGEEFLSCTPLGSIVFEETLVYYDGPQIFTASRAGASTYQRARELLFVEAVEENRAAKTVTWLIVPITMERLHDLKEKRLDLRDVVLHPDGTIYQAVQQWTNGLLEEWTEIKPEEIPTKWLQKVGVKLFR